jgi:hypothetical protein
MPDLQLTVLSAAPERLALTPTLDFRLSITETRGHDVDSIALRCQILVEAGRRPYGEREQEALLDLFGEPSRWGRTLRPMLWTHASLVVAAFRGQTTVDLPVPCTFDLSVSAGKYFFALEEGEVPLTLQFSGSVFWRDENGELSVAPIPWSTEATFRLPVRTWRALMDEHYPNSAWLCLRRDVVDRLNRYKARQQLPSWEAALEQLLAGTDQPASAGGGLR